VLILLAKWIPDDRHDGGVLRRSDVEMAAMRKELLSKAALG